MLVVYDITLAGYDVMPAGNDIIKQKTLDVVNTKRLGLICGSHFLWSKLVNTCSIDCKQN